MNRFFTTDLRNWKLRNFLITNQVILFGFYSSSKSLDRMKISYINLQEIQCFEWLEPILDLKHYLNLKHWLYINFQTTNRLMHKIWHKIVMQGEQFMVSSKMGVALHISTKVLMCPSSFTKFLNTKPPPQPNKPTLNSPNLKLSSIDEVAYCLLKK